MKAPSIARFLLVLLRATFAGGRGHRVTPQRLGALAAVVAMLCTLVLPALAHAAPADSWTTVAPMPTARIDLTATAGLDGRIYAIGGNSDSSYLATVEAYTPSTNSWTTLAPMPTARGGLAAATGLDGRIYAIGGYNSGSGGPLATVEAYTPSTNSWATVAPIPTASYFLAATTGADGRIYAIGGGNNNGIQSLIEAYSPSTNSWTTLAPMPTAHYALAAATGLDGHIYAIGGYNSGSLATVEAYTPSTNSWTTVAPMSTARGYLAAATGPDGRIYAIGGINQNSNSISYLATVEAYTPSTNSWTAVAPMSTARRDFAAATGPDGRIYAIGGINQNSSHLATVEAYTLAPVLAAVGAAVNVIEGALFSGIVANFTDSDGNTQASAYAATITWGDGSSSAGTVTATGSGFTVVGSHSYAEEGTAPITVQITDAGGSVATANSSATVADAALIATGTTAKLKGKRFSGAVANFIDANPGGTVADYTATIAWSDGSTSTGTVTAMGMTATGSTFTVSGDHTYPKHQSYVLSVTITDRGGSTATVQTMVGKDKND